jgi:hypothetical protein
MGALERWYYRLDCWHSYLYLHDSEDFQTIKKINKTMIKKILGWLTGTSKTVLEFIGPILQRSVSDILSKILPIALEVVKSLATDDEKTGAQKRNDAFRKIKSIATQEGIEAGNQTINLAIELALSRLRS